MKINSITIKNFRGIKFLEATDLGEMVIIAGGNGSGKSCIFDAIRLLKSAHGGYHQNEWHNFFNEFSINLQGNKESMGPLFNDPSQPIEIECNFSLRQSEKDYIRANLRELLEEVICKSEFPQSFDHGGRKKASFAKEFRERQPEIERKVDAAEVNSLRELSQNSLKTSVKISPNRDFSAEESTLVSLIFSSYEPNKIGIIDFHGAQRNYNRENINGISLNLRSEDPYRNQLSHHSLYNYNNKYTNIKSEMASNYLKELLREKATGNSEENFSTSETIKSLFKSFFPEKEFLGPTPTANGELLFPVRTKSGALHDIDELSSGEKEIIYGYLRIKQSAPKNSIVLLDEPELHLNPKLIRRLPEFYKKHLGEDLDNQIWLVTHSDALIRETIGKPGFNVFHMSSSNSVNIGESQLKPLSDNADIDIAIAELVGDLATYTPQGKAIIFEGGGDSDFDKTFVSKLFQEDLKNVNLLSGTNKAKVKALHEVLEKAYTEKLIHTRFYAITDKDSDQKPTKSDAIKTLSWDVYHIENYLLHEETITNVLKTLSLRQDESIEKTKRLLHESAEEIIGKVASIKLGQYANDILTPSLNLKFPPDSKDISQSLSDAIDRSVEKIRKNVAQLLSLEKLREEEDKIRCQLALSLADESWKSEFPGREILKRFTSKSGISIPYESFRNLLINNMVTNNYKPEGMKTILETIITDQGHPSTDPVPQHEHSELAS